MDLIADRYEPTGNASWGGMGEVNECIDKNLARKVVLKRVFKASDFPRLLDEQKALIKLRSKHVVQLLDVVRFPWKSTEITCLVLEYIEGIDLDKISFAPGTDYQKTLWQIASGIADIHQGGVIHRDIKPQNIRRDMNGIIKIYDFGLAREVGVDNKTRTITGTSGYMAPELFGSKTIAFSPAVDTYAFGRTALALLGCEPPSGKPQRLPPGAVNGGFPSLKPDICTMLEQCLDLSPSNRPTMKSVSDMLALDLLRDRHRARIIQGSTSHELHAGNRTARITSTIGSISIHYDGLRFVVASLSGNVFVNKKTISAGAEMTSSCVITLGHATLGAGRVFLSFDVSNPEVLA